MIKSLKPATFWNPDYPRMDISAPATAVGQIQRESAYSK